MSQSQPLLKALAEQDASRLPCGCLELFVFSTDRRKLLSLTKPNNDTKQDEKETNPQIKSVFITGSEDEYYYTMLQIENEIEKESLKQSNNNTHNRNKLNALQNEFNKWIDKAKK
eukprot:514154_1